jgi:DNA modification methylase
MLLLGDCRERMRSLAPNSVDSIVTDPPYHLTSIVKRFGSDDAAPAKSNGASGVYARASAGFMGQKWDGGGVAFEPETWAEAWRVLKPGGHLLAFSGSRTYHRMVCAIEDAGFEIRDQIMWVYGSGFPKSHDVSKGIDKKRDDNADVECVRKWLEARRLEAGITRKAINEAMGLASNGGGLASSWTTNGTTACVPQWEQWLRLKSLLNFSDAMDAEVWRLNGRKGKPGENWVVVGERNAPCATGGVYGDYAQRVEINEPSPEAIRWQGWGTALKPSHEPICVARKPLEGTVAQNVLKYGVGALNIDACRVPSSTGRRPNGEEEWASDHSLCVSCAEHVGKNGKPVTPEIRASTATRRVEPTTSERGETSLIDICRMDTGFFAGTKADDTFTSSNTVGFGKTPTAPSLKATNSTTSTGTRPTTGLRTCSACGATITLNSTGSTTLANKNSQPGANSNGNAGSGARWPANLIHDGSDEVVGAFPAANGAVSNGKRLGSGYGEGFGAMTQSPSYGDSGSAARFFYQAKASKKDRDAGLEGMAGKPREARYGTVQDARPHTREGYEYHREPQRNTHPTVKPTALMRYLCRLVTPSGGVVLDPFMGSGSTGRGAVLEGFRFIGIEMSPEYLDIARLRIAEAEREALEPQEIAAPRKRAQPKAEPVLELFAAAS